MTVRRSAAVLSASLAALSTLALTVTTAPATAAGPPPAATAFATGVVTPAGGSVTGFGVTATFAAGAVTSDRLIVLGNWPNGLDVTPPLGTAVKTFGLQECNVDGTGCTSEFGNYPNSPSGAERIRGQQVSYSGFQTLPDPATGNATAGNTTFGNAGDKLVTISTHTGADKVYVYNANFTDPATAYPKLLPSVSSGGSLTFQTFQPIVWVLTSTRS